MRVTVVGARGQLGAAVAAHARATHHEVAALSHAALDITDAAAVRRVLGELRPEVLINCAAYNAVDAAESQATDAIRLNANGVRNLVRAIGGAAFVHYGTDFVFDGNNDRPYVETDTPNPQSIYGMSKLMGEWFAADAPRAYILRVESLFGHAPDATPKGSVAGIIAALHAGGPARVFEDRTVSPTSVHDAARATLALIETNARPGLYHCVNTGSCTWLELGQEAARLLDLPAKFDIVRFADVKLPAPRPMYCALSNAKLAAAGVMMPTWQEALAAHVRTQVGARH
jgi:dTDP-4-dehydrorhamnose reductase